MPVLSEKRTEDIARELLEVRGWNVSRPPKGNVLWKNEYREFTHLRTAFEASSKTGGGPGYPDFIVIDAKTKRPLLVGETKASNRDAKIAREESIGYAKSLMRFGYPTLAVGIAGNAEAEISVSVDKRSDDGQWRQIQFRQSPIQWVPTPDETSLLIKDDLLFDLSPKVPSEHVLAKRADEINRIFRECKIKDEYRPAVIGAFMLGLVRTQGDIRTNPDFVLLDVNAACRDAFAAAGKTELESSILIPEANAILASRAAEVIYILRLLNLTTLSAAHDYLGQLYETFFRFTGGNTIGQFFTPRHIAGFMADICNVSESDIVVDPTCGTGGFSIASLYRMVGADYTKEQITKIVADHLIGFESEPITAALCVANMIIRGDGTTGVKLGDCFSDSRYPKGSATVALGNPPFPHKQTDDPPEKFVDRGLEALATRGLLAMIVPSSLLGKQDKSAWRESVLKHNTLKAAITLPAELFQPYASSTTGIIILERGVPHINSTKTFFCHISNDGYKIKKSTRVARWGDQLPIAGKSYANHTDVAGLCSFNSLTGFSEGEEWTPGAHIAAAEHSTEDILSEIEQLVARQVAFHALHAADLAEYGDALRSGRINPSKYGDLTKRKTRSNAAQGTIGEHFDIYYGQKALHNKESLLPGNSLIISSKGTDNGCFGFYNYEDVISAPFITAPSTGSIGETSVQLWPCGVSDDCLLLFPKPGTREEDLWIVAAIIRLERWRFNYGRKITPDRIADFIMRRDQLIMDEVNAMLEAALPCANGVIQALSGKQSLMWHGAAKAPFEELETEWKRDTALLSNVSAKVLHPAYQRIIGMGEPAIPVILGALMAGDLSEWFWALRAISGEDPVSEKVAGDVEKMSEAWIEWGTKKGYLNVFPPKASPNSQTSLTLDIS